MTAVNHFIKKGVRQARIDEFLARELQRAGYGGVEITKTPLGERITIYASRPGIVIGRRGKNIRMITDILANEYGIDNPQIEVKEVVNPELNPKVMAYTLVSAIERGVHRRRAAYSVLRRVLNAGAKGCEIIISGKLTSKRSRHEAYRMGFLAKSGEVGTQYVKTANATAIMKLGTIGVTVSIMRGDIDLPDEITIKSVKLEEPTTEVSPKEEAEVVQEEKPVAAKPEEAKAVPEKAAAPAEKVPKVKEVAVKEEKIPVVKKTSLDLEVEELSELIEKEPGEEKKAKKKEPAAKKEKAKAAAKKPAVKKPEEKPTTKAAAPRKKAEPKKEPAKAKKEPTKAKKEPTKAKKKSEEKKAPAKTAEKPKKSTKEKDAVAPAKKSQSKKAETSTKTAKKEGKTTSSKTKKETKAKSAEDKKKKKEK
ncbi:MAG: 30S ribosomal protein S3 [Candidatus Heimdallarchaeota archaeon]